MPDQGLPSGESLEQGEVEPDAAPAMPLAAWLGLLALAAGAVQRGGYYAGTRVVLVVLALAALLVALVGPRRPAPRVVLALLVGGGLIVGSAVLSATMAEDLDGAPLVAGLVLVFVAGAAVAAATPVGARAQLADGILLVGCVVAASAWVGVLWRISPWGYPVAGVWRGGSTISYANAAGALLAATAVVSLVRIVVDARAGWPVRLATYLVGVGLLATVSRASVLALLVGSVVALVVLRAPAGPAVAVRLAVAVAVGASGLVPSLDADVTPNRVLAAATLAAGGLVALGVDRRLGRPRARAAVLTGVAVAAVALVVLAPSGRSALGQVGEARLSFADEHRGGAWGAAVDVFEEHPVVGAGPTAATLQWSDGTRLWRIQFVHNELLELLATQGLVGLFAVLAAAVLLVRSARGLDPGEERWLRPAVLGALAALLVHGAFDFTLHVPVVVLATGLITGLGLPNVGSVSDDTSHRGDPGTGGQA